MRDKMERRLLLLPFSLGCFSRTSVSVGSYQLKTQITGSNAAITNKGGESSSVVRMKNSVGFLPLRKPNISCGIQRLIRSFKGFSQFFVYKEKAELEKEMEIGLPTDVKHVTHIGLDGTTATNQVDGWEDLKAPELLAFPLISLTQFELAMAAQADSDKVPIHDLVDSTKQC